ncbi:MAG: T9SS type A sorting domain-containing protein [Bacteroidales bacterium]
MFKQIIFSILSIISIHLFAQKNVNIPLAQDFKIITSDHDTLHLFKALSEGKTVVLDFFQISCGSCLSNTPIIDSAFLMYGSNQSDILFWGISNVDSNNAIHQFINTYNVHFPCAGIEGLGDSVVRLLENQMGAFGFPVYAVICPTDKTMHWNINNPATVHGFDQAINTCTSSDIHDKSKTTGDEKVKIFPNPTADFVNVEIKLEHTANLSCDLLGSMGEKISSKNYMDVQNGLSKFKISFESMREGNYYLTIYEDGNLVFAGMIVKVKNK